MVVGNRQEKREFATWIFAGRLFDASGREIFFIPFEASRRGIGILAEEQLNIGESYVMLLRGGTRLDFFCRGSEEAGSVSVEKKIYKSGMEAAAHEVDVLSVLKDSVQRL